MNIHDSFLLYVWAFPFNTPTSQLARELLFRCHGNEKLWELMEWWISIAWRLSIKARCLGELLFSLQEELEEVVTYVSFLRFFSGLNLMTLKQITSFFFGLSLARSSEGLSSCWWCWMCLWECSWSDTGLVRVHVGQCYAHSKDNWAEGQGER